MTEEKLKASAAILFHDRYGGERMDEIDKLQLMQELEREVRQNMGPVEPDTNTHGDTVSTTGYEPSDIEKALLDFQARGEDPTKTATADTGKYKYDYANIGSSFPDIRAWFTERGVIITFCVRVIEGVMYQVCRLKATSDGSHHEGLFPFVYSGSDAQASGSCNTYTMRYCLFNTLGIVAVKDDDGKAAKDAAASAPRQRQPSAADMEQRESAQARIKRLHGVLGKNGVPERDVLRVANGFLSQVTGRNVDLSGYPDDVFDRGVRRLEERVSSGEFAAWQASEMF